MKVTLLNSNKNLQLYYIKDLRFTGVGQLHKDLLGALETKMDAALIIPEIVQIILTNLIFSIY